MRFILLFLVGCGSSEVVPDASMDATMPSDGSLDRELPEHDQQPCAVPSRKTAVACSNTPRPAANDGIDAGSDANGCILDNECTAGSDGRCSELVSAGWYGFKALGTRCTYDACHSDGDCDAGVCGCEIGFAKQHLCLSRSNCKTNADCAGGACVFSTVAVLEPPGVVVTGMEIATGANNEGTLGWFCTTPNDECCAGATGDAGNINTVCVYSSSKKRWVWTGLP